MITRGSLLLDGVSAGDVFGYKDEQGNLRSKQGLVTIAEDKTAKSAVLVAAITSTPTGYVFDNTKVTAGDQHITGTVIPVSVTVHLSAVPGELTANALLSGEIGHTQADDTGIWGCDIHLDADSIIYAWATLPLEFSSTSAKMSIDQKPDKPDPGPDPKPDPDPKPEPEPDTPKAYTITAEFEAVANILNNATDFTFEATVSGPADLANIKLYAWDTDVGEYVLKESTVSGDNGNYGLSASWNQSGTPYEKFRVQAGTDDANGELSVSVEIYEAKCLSGDTLITLADRTERRLDELTGSELVLGGDRRPAHILRLARGMWSPSHTLYHFDDETVIDETHEHRFFNVEQGFWQKLKNWRVGDHAKRLDGGAPALVSVEPKEERAEMFGIWVERGSYWANGLLSGDASANRPLLADATVEQAIDMAESLAEKDLMRILGGGVPL